MGYEWTREERFLSPASSPYSMARSRNQLMPQIRSWKESSLIILMNIILGCFAHLRLTRVQISWWIISINHPVSVPLPLWVDVDRRGVQWSVESHNTVQGVNLGLSRLTASRVVTCTIACSEWINPDHSKNTCSCFPLHACWNVCLFHVIHFFCRTWRELESQCPLHFFSLKFRSSLNTNLLILHILLSSSD